MISVEVSSAPWMSERAFARAFPPRICGPASPRCGYWENWGFFYSAPQDLVVLGVFCARFPPREANIHSAAERRAKILGQPCMQP